MSRSTVSTNFRCVKVLILPLKRNISLEFWRVFRTMSHVSRVTVLFLRSFRFGRLNWRSRNVTFTTRKTDSDGYREEQFPFSPYKSQIVKIARLRNYCSGGYKTRCVFNEGEMIVTKIFIIFSCAFVISLYIYFHKISLVRVGCDIGLNRALRISNRAITSAKLISLVDNFYLEHL